MLASCDVLIVDIHEFVRFIRNRMQNIVNININQECTASKTYVAGAGSDMKSISKSSSPFGGGKGVLRLCVDVGAPPS